MNNDDPFKATVYEQPDPLRLQPGDVVRFEKSLHMVTYVNECRAAIVPLESNSVKYETRFGNEVEFKSQGRLTNIATHAPDRGFILERRGKKGLQSWHEGNKKDNPRANALLGNTVREVALAMGRYNWTFEDAKAALLKAGCELADVTIKKRLRRGKKHETTISEEQLNTLRIEKGLDRIHRVGKTTPAAAEEEGDVWAKVKVPTKKGDRAPTKTEKKILLACKKKPAKDKKKVRRK